LAQWVCTLSIPPSLPDPSDVPADLAQMIPFREGLAEHLASWLPHIRTEWLTTGHLLVLSQRRKPPPSSTRSPEPSTK
jgi:hypothetical protein